MLWVPNGGQGHSLITADGKIVYNDRYVDKKNTQSRPDKINDICPNKDQVNSDETKKKENKVID